MNEKLKISVIVCVHKQVKFLEYTLTSISEQTRPVDEIILVKSSLTPDIGYLENSFPLTIISQKKSGLANARNEGLKATSGELITFLDSDDIWVNDTIEKQEKYLQKNQISASFGYLKKFKDGHQSNLDSKIDFEKSIPAMTPGGVLLTRGVVDQIGYFDTKYQIATDHDWISRLQDSNLNFQISKHIVLKKRIHTENLSRNIDLYRKELLDMLKKRV